MEPLIEFLKTHGLFFVAFLTAGVGSFLFARSCRQDMARLRIDADEIIEGIRADKRSITEAARIIELGMQIMTPAQVNQWAGAREWLALNAGHSGPCADDKDDGAEDVEGAMDRFAEVGAKAWADVPDAAEWVRDLRGQTPPDEKKESGNGDALGAAGAQQQGGDRDTASQPPFRSVDHATWPRMVVCPVCGNKRCPKADDPGMQCTGSNEPGQVGTPETRGSVEAAAIRAECNGLTQEERDQYQRAGLRLTSQQIADTLRVGIMDFEETGDADAGFPDSENNRKPF